MEIMNDPPDSNRNDAMGLGERLQEAVLNLAEIPIGSDREAMAHLFLKELANCMRADGGSLFLKDPDRMILADTLDPGHAPDTIEFPLKTDSAFNVVMNSAAPLRVSDAGSDPRVTPSGATNYINSSFLTIPLIADRHSVAGVASLHNKVDPPFTQQDETAGLLFSAMWACLSPSGVAAAPPQSTKSRQTSKALRTRKRELDMIHEWSRNLNPSLDLDLMLEGILHSVRRFLDVAGSSVWLTDGKTGELVCRQATGLGCDLVTGWRLPPGKGIAGRVASEQRHMNVSDTRHEPYHFKSVDQKTGLEMRSILSVPLIGKKGVIGVIEVVDMEPNRFDTDSLRILEALAATAAVAIENARLYARTQREIAMRNQKEQDLLESEEKYRTILETMEEGYFETDNDGNFLFFNGSFRNILGCSEQEALGENYLRFACPSSQADTRSIIEKVLNTGKSERISDWQIIRKDGTRRDIEFSFSLKNDPDGRNVGFRGVVHDVTGHKASESSRKKLVRQLQQSQKMEAIGTLAGGIAHDFNNILTFIIGFAELAKSKLAEGADITTDLDEIIFGGQRAGDLVKRILAFSRQDRDEFTLVYIQTIIEEALELLRPLLPATIEIEKHLEESGPVLADKTQIQQVVMNLCTNAYDAMRKNGGILKIGLKAVVVNGHDDTLPSLEPGTYVRLMVKDTGHGMNQIVLDRIFDPYYTTKEKGKGTGLGLSMVHGIVSSHGGAVQATSEPGAGTRFFIFLPVVQQESVTAVPKEAPSPKGSEKILVVDDEPSIVKLCRQMLARQGYEVETRTSSLEALELFRKKPHRFDMVITDMTMSGLTGDQLAAEMMKIRPGIPVILCTGYSERLTEKQAMETGISAYAMKPLVMKELYSTIRNVLDKD